MFVRLQREVQDIVDDVIQLCWFMRGAIGYEEMMMRSRGERDRIKTFIESRLEAQKKSPFPIY